MADAWIKFCGCTSLRDVEMAREAGADAFGMIVAPSARRISPQAMAEIAEHLPAAIVPVAVFVDPSPAQVEEVRALFPAALLQFSGNESPEFVNPYGERAIKAIHVDESETHEQRARSFSQALLLFDTHSAAMAGGTGATFAWERIVPVARRRPVVIAGGLRPENVAACVTSTHPFGVDVRSGIETDGRKDAAKMRAFVRAVRDA